jgi:hypothetical protein
MPKDFPTIRVLSIRDLVTHEKHDDQRALPLIKKLQDSGILRNPPIVAPLNDGTNRYVVLDGANRTISLKRMGFPHIIAQVVETTASNLSLKNWNHIVWGLDSKELVDTLGSIRGINLLQVDRKNKSKSTNNQKVVFIQIPDETTYVVSCDENDIVSHGRLLNQVVDTYHHRSRYDRTLFTDIRTLDRLYKNLTAIVIFSRLEINDVCSLCSSGYLLPAGITRFIISPRVLRLNYPLNKLRSDKSLEEKNCILERWVRLRLKQKAVRFYAEATIMFDD